MYPKFNLYCVYPQFNHMHSPKYFDWVTDGSGELNFWVDDYIKRQAQSKSCKPDVAMLIEPRTIQPGIYKYVEQHAADFDLIFSHDDKILKLPNAYHIYFLQWYKMYDVPKTKAISMVCSDKAMCEEHKARKYLADILGNKVDHYGLYKGGYKCDYYECRAEYMFEVVVDNNWSGHWLSEKLANPMASKTIPIYLGGKKFPSDIDQEGIIQVNSVDEIPSIVDKILQDPEREYLKRLTHVENNYLTVRRSYQVFEDWFYEFYHKLLDQHCCVSLVSNNCVAGAISHDLELQHCSPTVSLQILPEEYPKFCKFIEDYLKTDLVEYKKEDLSEWHRDCLINMYGEIPDYPLATCGDILIVLRHYNSYEEGRECWNARKIRFNSKQVGFLFYVMDKKYIPYMNEFIEYKLPNSVILTQGFDVSIPVEHYRIDPERQDGFLDIAPNGRRYYEQNFNPVDWVKRIRKR